VSASDIDASRDIDTSWQFLPIARSQRTKQQQKKSHDARR